MRVIRNNPKDRLNLHPNIYSDSYKYSSDGLNCHVYEGKLNRLLDKIRVYMEKEKPQKPKCDEKLEEKLEDRRPIEQLPILPR